MEQYVSPQNVPYYFCKRTGESRWVRPTGSNDIVKPPVASPTPVKDSKTQMGEPESWESIGKTGWLRVETDKGFKYFFHKKSKKTSWSCPKEIAREVAELDGVLGTITSGSEISKPSAGGAAETVGTAPGCVGEKSDQAS